MSDFPRNITVHVNDDGLPQRLTVGDYEFDPKHIPDDICIERLTADGYEPTLWKLWLPIYVEGSITDPTGALAGPDAARWRPEDDQ